VLVAAVVADCAGGAGDCRSCKRTWAAAGWLVVAVLAKTKVAETVVTAKKRITGRTNCLNFTWELSHATDSARWNRWGQPYFSSFVNCARRGEGPCDPSPRVSIALWGVHTRGEPRARAPLRIGAEEPLPRAPYGILPPSTWLCQVEGGRRSFKLRQPPHRSIKQTTTHNPRRERNVKESRL